MPMVALSQKAFVRLGVLVGKTVVVHSFVSGVMEGGAECSAAHYHIGWELSCGCMACICHTFAKMQGSLLSSPGCYQYSFRECLHLTLGWGLCWVKIRKIELWIIAWGWHRRLRLKCLGRNSVGGGKSIFFINIRRGLGGTCFLCAPNSSSMGTSWVSICHLGRKNKLL